MQITEDQAQLFIEGTPQSSAPCYSHEVDQSRCHLRDIGVGRCAAADIDSNHTVERNEFRSLITHMASADLWSRQLTEAVPPAVLGLTCTLLNRALSIDRCRHS